MFTWICPQCGREVPPAYNDCPDCAKQTAQSGSPDQPPPTGQDPVGVAPPPFSPSEYTPPGFKPQPEPAPVYTQPLVPPPPQVYTPPPAQAPPVQAPPPDYPPRPRPGPAPSFLGLTGGPAASAAPPQLPDYPLQPYPPPATSFLGPLAGAPPAFAAPPAARRRLPVWLLTIVFTLAFLGLAYGTYWFIGSRGAGTPKLTATVESPSAKPGAKTSPYQKFIEISGVRFLEDAKKKPTVTFLIVNHSGAEIAELAGNVTIWGRTRTSEEEAAGTFTFKTSLGPNQSKELSSPLTTKLKFYELPDWQNVSTDIQITLPAASGGSAALR
jgi:hypothetical protein